ncbi:TPA: radical SAM protein [Candidatus Woesearchaeota archaeon]|nr:Radical SAM family protein [archaeon GW2011_AR15]MBS3104510.1 radical SAM protein [Candidatus Woesearchaeota archaeon]HIH41176.1 radical SAM protein [Candidatus Woesearchaeota archaeon]
MGIYGSGKIIIPPEVREIAKKGIPTYPDIIKYSEKLDVIGKYENIEDRKFPLPSSKNIPLIYLCGDTSENHRWGVDLDENDFFKQVDKLKEAVSKNQEHHIIIGIRRTNFHRLYRIIGLVMEIKGENADIPKFNILPLVDIKSRFYAYLSNLSRACLKQGIEFRIIDSQLDELLSVIENNSRSTGFNMGAFLRTLGPVVKDVFSGPENILLDLSGKCNLDCVYCRKFSPWNKKYWDDQHSELFGMLDIEIVENSLKEAKELGAENVFLVGGAEPTMHPQFGEILKITKDLGLNLDLVTNGSMLHLYKKQIVEYGNCQSINVSLSYASEKSWKLVRPNSPLKLMKKIEDNILELSQLKKDHNVRHPFIQALYVINQYNFTEIVDMAYHAKKIGADKIWYQLVHLENFSVDKLYMKKSDMDFVKKELEKAREVCKEIGIEFHSFIEFEIKHYDKNSGSWGNKGLLSQGCYVGWCFTYVSLRREVFMCCGARMIGLLEKDGSGLKDVWLSDAYTRYRNDGLIMHKENPLTLYGRLLYDDYCDSCDNHDQNTMMVDAALNYDLLRFVER